jgi:hypothetical protein
MNSNDPGDDLVEQAIKALLRTAGPDEPPATVLSRVRRAMADRQAAGLAKCPVSGTPRDRISWLALAATLLLMVASGCFVGFHRRLFSEIAGQESAADGSRHVFYTDGRVEVTGPATQLETMLDPRSPPKQGVT